MRNREKCITHDLRSGSMWLACTYKERREGIYGEFNSKIEKWRIRKRKRKIKRKMTDKERGNKE